MYCNTRDMALQCIYNHPRYFNDQEYQKQVHVQDFQKNRILSMCMCMCPKITFVTCVVTRVISHSHVFVPFCIVCNVCVYTSLLFLCYFHYFIAFTNTQWQYTSTFTHAAAGTSCNIFYSFVQCMCVCVYVCTCTCVCVVQYNMILDLIPYLSQHRHCLL